MPNIDTIVIGASAGGVEALSRLVHALPSDLPATVLAVLHFPESSTSALPQILSRNGALPAKHAEEGEEPRPGQIYVAPPAHHLLLHGDRLVLGRGPKENGARPAIDPLFRTAAHSRGSRVVGVLLSGLLDDGTMGQGAVCRHGGTTICQDPEDALFGDMPRNAIQGGACGRVLPLAEIGAALAELAGREAPPWEAPERAADDFLDPTEMNLSELNGLERRGAPSAFVCPECHGTLFELTEEGVRHYRCRVGHSYLPESLASHQSEQFEAALWTALRAIEEHNDLIGGMLERAEAKGFTVTAKGYRTKLEEGAFRMETLRQALGLGRPDANFNPGGQA